MATLTCASLVDAPVRGRNEVRRSEERRILGGLGFEHVERRAANLPRIKRVLESRFGDQAAPRAVHDAYAWLRLGEILAAEDVARLIGQRRVQGDEVGAAQQVFQLDLLDAQLDCALCRQERVEGHDFHSQAQRAARDNRADVARADQAKRLAGDLDAHEAILFPLAGLRRSVGFRELAGEGEHQGDGVFGGRDRVAERSIHDDHAPLGRRRNVDIIDADAARPTTFRLVAEARMSLVTLSTSELRDRRVADDRLQLVRRLAGDFVDLNSALAEDLGGARVHLVADQTLGWSLCFLGVFCERRNPVLCKEGLAPAFAGTRYVRLSEVRPRPSRAKVQALRCPKYRPSRAHQMRRPGGASRYPAMS